MVESRQILSPMTQWNKMQITLITDSLGNLCTCFDRMAKTTWRFPFGSPFQTCLSHRLILRIKQNNWEEGRCFSFKWQTDAKSWLTGKYPDSGKDWRQEEKGTIEDEMVGWYHRLNRHEFEQILRDGERQESLECCSPWGRKESDTTEWLNNFICKVSVQLQNYTTKRTTNHLLD